MKVHQPPAEQPARENALRRMRADVAATRHTDEDGANTAELAREAGGRGIVCQLDVTAESSVKASFATVDEQWSVPQIGGLDVNWGQGA